jgi:GT2 family glycosyltransferase
MTTQLVPTIDRIVPTCELSIVVVNWNTRDLLGQCLESIYAYPPDAAFEVLVVDNGSMDASCEMVRERFPRVHLIPNRQNVGFARANNQAIHTSTGAYLLLLNSDAQILPGALNALLYCARGDASVGIVGGKLLNADGSFQAGGNAFPTLWSELLLLTGLARRVYSAYFPSYPPRASEHTRSCDWVGGACLLARREAIETVGLLDETYAMYVEEVDWCYRVRAAGWKIVYCAEGQVIHHGGKSADRVSPLQLQRLYSSKARFLERRLGALAAGVFRASVRAVAVVQALRWQFASRGGRPACEDRVRAYLSLARVEL